MELPYDPDSHKRDIGIEQGADGLYKAHVTIRDSNIEAVRFHPKTECFVANLAARRHEWRLPQVWSYADFARFLQGIPVDSVSKLWWQFEQRRADDFVHFCWRGAGGRYVVFHFGVAAAM